MPMHIRVYAGRWAQQGGAMNYRLERGQPSGGQRAGLLRDVAKALREKDREKLARLRAQVDEVRKRKRGALRDVRSQCRRARREVRERVRQYRESERQRINAEVGRMRDAAQLTCAMKQEAVRDAAAQESTKARRALAAERQLQRDLRSAEQWERQKLRRLPRVPHEARSESDDRVRANIDPSLVPVFEKVKRSIKGNPRMSRTEAFLHWVEENPGDAVALQQAAADEEIKKLLREQREAERDARRRRKRAYKPSKAELDEYLRGVPF